MSDIELTFELKALIEEYEKIYNMQNKNGRYRKCNRVRSEKLLTELIEKYYKPYKELEKQLADTRLKIINLSDSQDEIPILLKEEFCRLLSASIKYKADFNLICPFMHPDMLAREWFINHLLQYETYLTSEEKEYKATLESDMKTMVDNMNSNLVNCATCQTEIGKKNISFLYGLVTLKVESCQCTKANKHLQQIEGRIYRVHQPTIIYIDPIE
jgi:hypothetical protein